MDDSTFRAYRNNPKFLSSILPLSQEFNAVLGRIFECDPRKRIGIPALRALILRCPNFTTRPSAALPPTPPNEPQYVPQVPVNFSPEFLPNFDQCATVPHGSVYQPVDCPVIPQLSVSSSGSAISDNGSTFSEAFSCSSTSSVESLVEHPKVQESGPVRPCAQSITPYFQNHFSMDPVPRPMIPQSFLAQVQAC